MPVSERKAWLIKQRDFKKHNPCPDCGRGLNLVRFPMNVKPNGTFKEYVYTAFCENCRKQVKLEESEHLGI